LFLSFRVYHVRYLSGLATVLSLVAIVTTIVCDFVLIATMHFYGIVTLVPVLLLAFIISYLIKYFRQKIEVETMVDRIMIRYLHKPFCDRVADRQILAGDILSYSLSDGSRGKGFTLHLRDSSDFNCTVSSFGDTTNFDEMTASIISLIHATASID
jgi:hypothetical protein